MTAIKGDIWDFHRRGKWVCITTNGYVKGNGECVMGRGTAQQAARKFKNLPYELGNMIKLHGNHVHVFPKYRVITFPVKHNWFDDADLELIKASADELMEALEHLGNGPVYLPKPGCGNGNLKWTAVWMVIDPILDDRVVIVDYEPRVYNV